MENELNKQSTPNYNKTTSDGNTSFNTNKSLAPEPKFNTKISDNVMAQAKQRQREYNFKNMNQSVLKNYEKDSFAQKFPEPDLSGKLSDNVMGQAKSLAQQAGSKIKPKGNFSTKFSNSTFGKNYGFWSQGLDTANQLFTSIAGPKSEYGGKYGNLAKSLDSGYDTISNVAGTIPGWGQAASLIMKGAGLVNNIGNKIGLGTDGMTKQDVILSNPLFAPLGWINGGLGSRTKSYVFNKQLFNQLNGSYGNALDYANQANDLQRKKFGLTSGGKKKYANNLIDESIRQAKIMEDIAENATDRSNIAKSMTMFNNMRNNFELSGSYNYGLQAAKNGAKLSQARQILKKYKKQQINSLQKGGRTLDELINYAKKQNPRFIQRMSEPIKQVEWDDSNGHHFGTHELGYTEANGKFMIYPMIQEDSKGNLVRYSDWKQAADNAYKNKNILWVDTAQEAELFTKSGEDNNGNLYGYKKGWPQFFKKKLQNGGTLEYSVIELVTPEIESFKQGGTINVIPDGALHAHKNNMGLDNITPKGIPVVDNDNEQQAEIEREELILIKSVTEKLEELYKKYQESQDDDIAIEAGKLLVEQILHNTQDNTNKLL